MKERSRLDEIEDLEFAVSQLVHKGKSSEDVIGMLQKRGASADEINVILESINQKYSGVRQLEVSTMIRAISFIIDFAVIFIIVYSTEWVESTDGLTGISLLALKPLLYYFLLESSIGQTFGKLITASIVVDENGKIPKPVRILIRTISRLYWKAILSIFLDGRTFHDDVSKTFVVDKKRWNRIYNTF